ncbi:MAG TPA: phosphatase PAP2 family protein, partial [Gaiellaceae bacterium]|nr:phosphatase PAP2 family protein [Gaiellaceae bacterium]
LPGGGVSGLVEKAESVAARAYAPYSNYNVGAVVRTADGREFEGVNVENAAYPLGVCAEKSALVAAVAAGAVLIATAVAVAVGYLVFSGQVADRSSRLLDRLTNVPAELTLIALFLTTIVVLATKALTGRGTPLRGGLPSGHAAVAFAGWMAATLILDDSEHHFLISSLTFIMALLVAQTRVESGVHSSVEVAYGGLLGALVTLAVFQVAA